MKKILRLTMTLLAGTAFLSSCQNYPDPTSAPEVVMVRSEDVYRRGATLIVSYYEESNNGSAVKERGIYISTASNMSDATSLTDLTPYEDWIENAYKTTVSDLQGGVTYYIQGYISSGGSTATGYIESFTTPEATEPILDMRLGSWEGIVNVELRDDGGSDIVMSGFCLKRETSGDEEPTVNDLVFSASIEEMEEYSMSNFTGLLPNSTYRVRAFAINSKVGYSGSSSFETNGMGEIILQGDIDPWNDYD